MSISIDDIMAPSRKRSGSAASLPDSLTVAKRRAKCPDFTQEDKERIALTVLYLAPRYIAQSNRRGRKKSGELPLSSRPLYAKAKLMLGLEHQADSILHCFKSWLKKNGDTWEQMREQAHSNEDVYFADLLQLEKDLIAEGILEADDESVQEEFKDGEEATGDGWDVESQHVETGSNEYDPDALDRLLDSPKLKQEKVEEEVAAADADPPMPQDDTDTGSTQAQPTVELNDDDDDENDAGPNATAGAEGGEQANAQQQTGGNGAEPSRPTGDRPQFNLNFYAPINIYIQNRGGLGGWDWQGNHGGGGGNGGGANASSSSS